jgi:hypothetical protein
MSQLGVGEITQVQFGATTVAASYIEGFSVDNAPDTYTSGLGFDVERGSITKTVTCSVLDYSAFSALNTLMTARTKSTVTVTYMDGNQQVFANCIITVVPLIHQVPDACQVFLGAAGAEKNDLDAAYGGTTGVWTDLGVTLDVPAPTFDLAFQGSTGCGLPYYSSVNFMEELILPEDVYSEISNGSSAEVAIRLPDGNWLVFANVYTFKHYTNEDASAPRSTRLHLKAVADNWNDIISYHDGNAGVATPSDYFAGCAVTASARGYAETDVVSLA